MAEQPIVLIGAGDTGLAVLELLRDSDLYRVIGFLDDLKTGQVDGIPILGAVDSLIEVARQGIRNVAVTISLDIKARERIVHSAKEIGLSFPILMHKSSIVSSSATLEEGVISFALTHIDYGTRVGRFSILKPYSWVSFHATIGAFCLLGPYSHIGSYSSVGSKTFLLAKSTIASRCQVGENCIVYPHSYVNKPIPSNSKVYGAPAKYDPIET